ncbi:MAG TPA: hypothetical protein VMW48_04085, partial [Vicinamibacterales bacterium]|nr:hypothetical protein [Vicinamibacterales bacterium]
MADIVIFGAGDIGRLAHHYFSTDSPHRVVAFTVDAEFRTAETFCGLPVVALHDVMAAYPTTSHAMFVAMSYARMNQAR